MLPAPVSFRTGRARGLLTVPGPTSSTAIPLRELLRAPARITNFAALLLLCVTLVSLYLNLNLWASSSVGGGTGAWPRSGGSLPPSIAATLERSIQRRLLDHLVIVPGHGIWTGAEEEDILDEKYWLLAEYQRNRGRPAVFLEHIRRASVLPSLRCDRVLTLAQRACSEPRFEVSSHLQWVRREWSSSRVHSLNWTPQRTDIFRVHNRGSVVRPACSNRWPHIRPSFHLYIHGATCREHNGAIRARLLPEPALFDSAFP